MNAADTLWKSHVTVAAVVERNGRFVLTPRHRTPLVIQCVDDSVAGRRYPLQLISNYV